MYLVSNFAMGDIENDRHVLGTDIALGPIVPLVLMGVVVAVGFVLFAVTAELVDRGSIRQLVEPGPTRRRPLGAGPER